MGTYNFKSSGITQATQQANKLAVTLPVIGIVTPLMLGTTDLLATSTDLGTQVVDNFRNLLQTNWGERLGLYDFGANLKPLLSDLTSPDDFDSQAVTRIKNAVQRWMPYIDLVNFLSEIDRTGRQTPGIAQVTITITFSIPNLNIFNRKTRVTLYAI